MKLFGSDCLSFVCRGLLRVFLCLSPLCSLTAQEQQTAAPDTLVPALPQELPAGWSVAADSSALSPSFPAEEALPDTVEPRYMRHAEFVRTLWARLTPQYLKVQYAGSIGLISIGTGWDYGKRDRWETDVLLGFTPKYEDKRIKVTLTLREQFTPWSIPLKRAPRWSIEPLTCGLFMSTTFDKRFWAHEPGRYPSGYYGFSTKIRFNLFLGQQCTVNIAQRKALHRAVSFYYQLSISELNLVSAWGNSYLRPSDYLSLAFGLKLHLLD